MALSEFQLIDILRGLSPGRDDVLLGIGDDAAVLAVPEGQQLVACVDAIVEGVHFPAGTAASDVGWRALAVNLSDLAAMGAEPRWATLALTLPGADEEWVRAFAGGFFALAERYGVALVGGDTVRGPLNVCVQLLGTVAPGRSLLRSGARPGDGLWVTGSLGDAAVGLGIIQGKRVLSGAAEGALGERFLRPLPRVAFGRSLCGLASAAIDVSDGLFQDAQHLALASGVGLTIDADKIPLSNAIRSLMDERQALECAFSGGDDYELLFTLPPSNAQQLQVISASLDTPCARIGTVIKGENVTCALEGKAWMPSYTGFDHFVARRPE